MESLCAETTLMHQTTLREQQKYRLTTLRNDKPSLEAKLLNAGIRYTAEKMGFPADIIRQYGTTPINIVYGKVSEFSNLLNNIAEICLNKNLRYKV
jgi:hypothetical protein